VALFWLGLPRLPTNLQTRPILGGISVPAMGGPGPTFTSLRRILDNSIIIRPVLGMPELS
jgi:hypothetical protein